MAVGFPGDKTKENGILQILLTYQLCHTIDTPLLIMFCLSFQIYFRRKMSAKRIVLLVFRDGNKNKKKKLS